MVYRLNRPRYEWGIYTRASSAVECIGLSTALGMTWRLVHLYIKKMQNGDSILPVFHPVSCPEIGLHINVNKMNRKKQAQINNDRQVSGLSYRTLGKKYGEPISSIHRMVNKKQKKYIKQEQEAALQDDSLPDDVKALKEELRKARLKIELQDLMIDIASKELGVDIRKKPGTRRS